jgi:hypothetical protein
MGLFRLMLLTGLFGMMSASFAQQAEMIGGGAGITVFRDRDFRGAAATYRTDMPNLDRTEFNDQISSVRVAAGEQWEVCEHANYRGRCVIISGEENDLRRNSWDNMISSFRRVSGGGYPGPGPYPGQQPYIILHTDTNYRGAQTRYTDLTNNLFAMNNRAESITVGRGEWQVCEGIGFGGRCATVTRSISDLSSIGMKDRIRSVRPVGYDVPNPNPGAYYIVIYDRVNYRGNPTNFDDTRQNVNKRASSLTIGGGNWVICDGRNFTGRCMTVGENIPNLGVYNIGNTIRSIRPAGFVPQPVPDPYIVIFDQENYRGNPRNFSRSESNINVRAESITVGAGIWEVCSERNFAGRCETISQSMPNLRNADLRNRIRSLRPLRRQPR